jgi:3-methyladenine DNA glycosylase/8-oxoguanine DNA glycosylase
MALHSPPDTLQRAALALLGGRQPLVHVAREAGFAGIAPFAAAFGAAYHVQPQALRGWAGAGRYRIGYGGPFHLEQTLRYLGRDPENLAERVQGRAYTRFFPLDGRAVPVTLTFGASACTVDATRPRAAVRALDLHLLLRRFLGLEQPLAEFYRLVQGHRVFGPLTAGLPGVRIPQLPSLWEALCWAVVGQQINLAFAYRLRNRLIALGNGADAAAALAAPDPLPFPTPEQVLRLTPEGLRERQFSRQKAGYVLGLARACADGRLDEAALRQLPPEAAEAALLAQKGLGPWSAAYALMRGLGHPDALPIGDTGLRTALQRQFRLREPPDVKRQQRLMEPFRPYRSLATYYLWKSLSAPAGD